MQVLQQNMPVTNSRQGQGSAIHTLAPQFTVGLHSMTAQHSSVWYTGCHGLQCILQIEEIKLWLHVQWMDLYHSSATENKDCEWNGGGESTAT